MIYLLFIRFSEIGVDNQITVSNSTKLSLAKGPNKDLLRQVDCKLISLFNNIL